MFKYFTLIPNECTYSFLFEVGIICENCLNLKSSREAGVTKKKIRGIEDYLTIWI